MDSSQSILAELNVGAGGGFSNEPAVFNKNAIRIWLAAPNGNPTLPFDCARKLFSNISGNGRVQFHSLGEGIP
jgi:hypothetical protein